VVSDGRTSNDNLLLWPFQVRAVYALSGTHGRAVRGPHGLRAEKAGAA